MICVPYVGIALNSLWNWEGTLKLESKPSTWLAYRYCGYKSWKTISCKFRFWGNHSDPKRKQKFPRVHSRLCFSHLVRISLISCNLIFAGMINSVLVASPACPICGNDHEGSLVVIRIFILQSRKPWVVLRGFVSCYQWKVPSQAKELCWCACQITLKFFLEGKMVVFGDKFLTLFWHVYYLMQEFLVMDLWPED